MRIGVDVMGGDNAPDSVIDGALMAAELYQEIETLVLFGDQDIINNQLQSKVPSELKHKFEVVHCTQTIEMGDSPMRSLQSKPDSSINKGFDFLIQEKIDGFASAGNTGAVIAGAVIKVGVLQEGLRPCLMATLPKLEFRDGIILDIGANADTKPENLLQFAILGQNYAQHILGYSNPTVGLLNIGSEPDKGSESTKAAYKLLEDSPSVNFIGNVEGNDLFTSEADVIVTPGFTGNIVTKLCEHWYSIFKKSGFSTAFLDKFDFEKHGGSPVLGVKKPVLKGHGSSSSRAIKHLIIATAEVAKTKLSEKISNSLVNA